MFAQSRRQHVSSAVISSRARDHKRLLSGLSVSSKTGRRPPTEERCRISLVFGLWRVRKYSRLKMQERRGAHGARHREKEAEASNCETKKISCPI